ncbi:MAG: RHS domain-containing protein [Candidatus Thiodiazotropha sp. (ex Clathrolucina costata)]|nr:RHS domain-containing protein [Candidatus Thiodiazotropha taylori]
MEKKHGMMIMKKALIGALTFLPLLLTSPATVADIDERTGTFTHNVTDILVKSLGGSIDVSRTWDDGQWTYNKSHAPLKLVYGIAGTGSSALTISSIDHVGETFDKSGESSTNITMPGGGPGYRKRVTYAAEGLNSQWFVREGDIAGTTPNPDAENMLPIRWENRGGQWAVYLKPAADATTARIDRYGDRTGLTASFIYDANDRLIRIDDRGGNSILTYTYNASDQLSDIQDNSGRRVEYRYSGELLTEVVDLRGNLTRYAYQNNRLTQITDQANRVTEIAYGNTGRVGTETRIDTDGTRSVTGYRYDYDRTRKEIYVQVRDPNGGITEKWYDNESNLIRKAVNNIQVYSQTIDKANKRYHIRDQRNLETVEQYDAWFNRIQVTHPDGSSASARFEPGTDRVLERTDELGRITRYSYDTAGNLTQRIEAAGTEAERTTQYQYDANGLLIEKRRLADADTQEAITTYGYDADGNLNIVTGPEGGDTRYTHNIWGGVLTRTDPNNHTWHYTYDAAGNRLTQTDPLQRDTAMTYDGVGNRLTITDPRTHITRYAYDAHNQQTTVTDPLTQTTRMSYDPAGQLTGITDPLGNSQQIVYDLSKRPISQQDAAGNLTTFGYGERLGEGGGLTGSVNYPGRLNRMQYPTYLQTYDYDNRNRRTRVIDHLDTGAAITTTTYDEVGNKLSTMDAEDRVTQYRYDALNRLIEIIDPLNQSTLFSYDNRDNLLSVTDPNGHTTRYTYDRADHKTSEIRPGGQTISYVYDLTGNLTTTTDPDGRRTVNTYDDANQLETQAHYAPGATDPERTVTYSYDANGNFTGWNDGAISTTLVYDVNNRKTSETVNYGSFSLTHSYTYDAAGNKRTYTGPDNITVTYHRVNDQLNRIELPNEGSITYNSYRWNQPTRITYPGGSNRQTEYDNLLRPTRILTEDPGQNPLMDYQYNYDSTGNILQKATQAKTVDYNYDLLQRLTEAAATIQPETGDPQVETEGWQYDPNGNRTQDNLNPGSWVYDLNDRLQSSPIATYGYDQAGNTISKTEGGIITHYRYNAEGRLARIEDANQVLIAEYLYDPLGRRIRKQTQSEIIYFHYADEGLMGEFSETGSAIRSYGYQPDSTWTTNPIYQKTAQGYAYYQNDHLGTPQQLIQKSGAKVWEGVFRAFGELTAETATWENRLRFPGQYYDQETNSYYNFNRFYDPSVGRYTRKDPIGIFGGLNTYAYVGSNPIYGIDPYGLWCELSYLGRNILEHWSETNKRDTRLWREEYSIPVADKYDPADCAHVPTPPIGKRKTIWFDSVCFPPPVKWGKWVLELWKYELFRVDHYKVNHVYLEECYDDCTGELISSEYQYMDPVWEKVDHGVVNTTYELKEWVE